MKKFKVYFYVLLTSIVLISNFGIIMPSVPSLGNQQFERDYWPTEGWQVSTPGTQNMSKSQLKNMVSYIKDKDFAIDSVLIVKNGYIVF